MLLEHKTQTLSFTSYFSFLVNPYLTTPRYLTDVLEICYLYAPSTYPAVTENVPSPKATKPLPPPEIAHSSHHPPTNKSERSQQAPKPLGPTSPLPGKHQSPVNRCRPLPSLFIFPADWSKTRSFRRGSALTHRLPHHTHICPFITTRTSCLSPH